MFEKVLLAVDGSEHALHAARTAADLARPVNAKEFRIVVVYDSIPPYLGEPNLQQAIDARMEERKSDSCKKQSKQWGKFPVKFTPNLSKDHPLKPLLM